MDLTEDVQPVTQFLDSTAALVARLKVTGRTVVLTVDGKAAAVVQDPEAYQRLLTLAAAASEAEGVAQGRDDVAHGRTQPAQAFFDTFRAQNGLSR